jgi:phage gp36-like protein
MAITEADLKKHGQRPAAIDKFKPEEIEAACTAAWSEFEMIVGPTYSTPVGTVPEGVKMHVARAAVYHLYSTRGMDLSGADELIDRNYSRALKFYDSLRKGEQVMPKGQTDATHIAVPDVIETGCDRGWNRTSGV